MKTASSQRSGATRTFREGAGLLFFLMWFLVLTARSGVSGAAADALPERPPVRFVMVDVMMDAGTNTLAAYQIELSATNGAVKIVAIEGGDRGAFHEPPYYDPKALQQARVILAAFSTAPAGQLPKGETRLAALHLQVPEGVAPAFTAQVRVAVGPDEKPIDGKVRIIERSLK